MIRRLVDRVRSAARAPLVPLHRLGVEIDALGPTLRAVRTLAFEHPPRRGKRLRVGVDILPFHEPLTGIGWYLFHLLEKLADRDDLELVLFGAPLMTDEGPRLHVSLPERTRLMTIDLRDAKVSRLSRPLAALTLPVAAKLEQCDVFFAANYFLPARISPIATRRVITIHDLTFRRHPELLQAETLTNLDRKMHREIELADRIICVSDATRRDLHDFYRVEREKVVTIHSGVAEVPERKVPVARLPQRYLLFVSTIEPRKDVATLIDAFELLKQRGSYDGDLVLVGKIGWKSEAIAARLSGSRWRDSILHLDYLTREELADVYSRAEIVVFPSIYEGFGFPLLEAMLHGVPVIASNSSSLPEVGGDAAIYFETGIASDLASKIDKVTTSSSVRDHLITLGKQRVKRFSWRKAADETAEVLWKVVRG